MITSAWTPGWQSRILCAVQALGFPSVYEFVATRPEQPLGELFEQLRAAAAELGHEIAFVQLHQRYFAEAETRGSLRRAVADLLSRAVRQHFGKGWKRDKQFGQRSAKVLRDWPSPQCWRNQPIGYDGSGSIALAVFDALEDLNPPEGWRPTGPDDSLIVAAIDRGWPQSAAVPTP